MCNQFEISQLRSQLSEIEEKLKALEEAGDSDKLLLHHYKITLRFTTNPITWGLAYGPDLTPQDVEDAFKDSMGDITEELGFNDEWDDLVIESVSRIIEDFE